METKGHVIIPCEAEGFHSLFHVMHVSLFAETAYINREHAKLLP